MEFDNHSRLGLPSVCKSNGSVLSCVTLSSLSHVSRSQRAARYTSRIMSSCGLQALRSHGRVAKCVTQLSGTPLSVSLIRRLAVCISSLWATLLFHGVSRLALLTWLTIHSTATTRATTNNYSHGNITKGGRHVPLFLRPRAAPINSCHTKFFQKIPQRVPCV